MKYKVMIVDDQFVARQLFELYVKSSDNYEVAVSVDTAAMVENLLETVTVDLIIMDVLMNDGSNGRVAAEKIKKLYPEIKIIVVTSMAEVSWMERARKAGIEGFWYKEASGEDILSVMDAVMAGEAVYPDIQAKGPARYGRQHGFHGQGAGGSADNDKRTVECSHCPDIVYI